MQLDTLSTDQKDGTGKHYPKPTDPSVPAIFTTTVFFFVVQWFQQVSDWEPRHQTQRLDKGTMGPKPCMDTHHPVHPSTTTITSRLHVIETCSIGPARHQQATIVVASPSTTMTLFVGSKANNNTASLVLS